MAKIMIGIPSVRNLKSFHDSMDAFLPVVAKKHQIEVVEARDRLIDDARNCIADIFLKKDYDYLLFLDDDHSGHSLEMVDELLRIDADIAAIKCYSRFFPYSSNLMDYSKNGTADYVPKDFKCGHEQCDLVGFGMTLVKKSVFQKLPRPFFLGVNNFKEDNFFCGNAKSFGLKIVGCFDYLLTHAGIDDSNVNQLRKNISDQIIKKIHEHDPDFKVEKLLVSG